MVGQVKELATLKRVDDEHRRSLVMQARALIYSTKGVALSNKNVEALLKGTSLVPTLVRGGIQRAGAELYLHTSNPSHRTLSASALAMPASTSTR